jgi:uncharacterized metal-binding protein
MRNTVAWKSIIGGESSNRPQHLAFNDTWYKFLWFACPSFSLAAGVATISQGVDIGFIWEPLFIPSLFRFHEIFATPDNDEAYKVKGFRGFYWTPYARKFKHRSLWSHTLTFGTPMRFCIAYWFPILAFVLGWNAQVLYSHWGAFDPTMNTDISYWLSFTGSLLSSLTFPVSAAIFIGYWYFAALLSDLAHLILDRYNPIEWFVGK